MPKLIAFAMISLLFSFKKLDATLSDLKYLLYIYIFKILNKFLF